MQNNLCEIFVLTGGRETKTWGTCARALTRTQPPGETFLFIFDMVTLIDLNFSIGHE